jgi:hypothetical protein
MLQRAYRRAVRQALKREPRPDLVYWWGHPFWYFPLAPRTRAESGIPYVLDFEDVWYMRGVTYGRGQRSGLRHLLDGPSEAWAVSRAELLVLTSDMQAEIYRRRYPHRPGSSVATVYWGYDADRLRGLQPAPKPDGTFRIGIFGRFSVYCERDADSLAAAVAACRDRARVDVVHMGLPEPRLAEAFRRAGVADLLRTTGLVGYEEGMGVMASCDCAVLNSRPVSLPVKAYDYIALNLPMLAFAPPDTALRRLLDPFDGALLVDSAEEAIEALGRMVDGRTTRLEDEPAPEFYSTQHQWERLMDMLARAVADAGGGWAS